MLRETGGSQTLIYFWRYRARNLNRETRIRCSGLHLTTRDWDGFLKLLQHNFLEKKLSKLEILGTKPDETLKTFARQLDRESGTELFLTRVTFECKRAQERMFELQHFERECKVGISPRSLEDLTLSLPYLEQGEDQWVIADEPIDNKHFGVLHQFPS